MATEQARGPKPGFLAGSGLAREAYEFAARAHAGQDRKGDGTPYIRHPVAVAELLAGDGADEAMLAAAFLHDVVEDTEHEITSLRERFGEEVGALVSALTEDETVEPYEARKDHHRDQVEAAGGRAVRIYAADKLANVRDLRAAYRSEGEEVAARFKAPLDLRVRLWRRDVEMITRVAPDLEILSELRSELDALEAERAAAA